MMPLSRRLREALAQRKLIPFIGAGMSAPSGIPLWSSLVADLAEQRGQSVRDYGDLPLPDVAELVDSLSVTDHAAQSLFVEKIDDPRYRPNPYHRLLREVGFSVVITTNWDLLLEDEFGRDEWRVHTIYREGDVTHFNPTSQSEIIKLHGTIQDPDSLVYRKSDYRGYWDRRPIIYSLLTTLLTTNSALFLGYGFGDPNILDLLTALEQRLGRARREHWALSYGNPELERLWERLGVEVIRAPASDGPGRQAKTIEFLNELSELTGSAAYDNLARARLVNRELHDVNQRRRPHTVLRMRGALGWLSNPEPIPDDPIYGSPEQDAEEWEMTQNVLDFLRQDPTHRVRCILHVKAAPLLAGYERRHLARRLAALRERVLMFPEQIEVAHSDNPSHFNQMIFDDTSSLLGFRLPGLMGIRRVFVSRDRASVQREAVQFDADFWDAVGTRLGAVGPDDNPETLGRSREDLVGVLDEELRRLRWLDATTATDRNIIPASRLEGGRSLSEEAERLGSVFGYAAELHAGQLREDGATPYFVHPVRVAERLRRAVAGLSDELLCAALLHDVIEDTPATFSDLHDRFGQEVATLVEAVSKPAGASEQEYLAQLTAAPVGAAALKLADRWDNVWELRLKRYSSFGGISIEKYLEESERVLEVCAAGDATLAAGLQSEIQRARAERE